jgi:EAL domain-containing protein (putative c-di-GMP-specific phosphodiesterase class I)
VTLRSAGYQVPIAVNLTPRDLLDADLVEDLAAIFRTTGVEPGAIHIEITEDAMVVDYEMSIAVLNQLRELGIRVAIDDFGTGYSSLQHLHHLPIDELKIDRSFITRMDTDDSAAAIVRASVNLANDLGLGTVGEGIEDEQALRTLARLGCTDMQGYLFSRPLPIHDLVRFARGWSPTMLLDRLVEPLTAAHTGRVVAEVPTSVPSAAMTGFGAERHSTRL